MARARIVSTLVPIRIPRQFVFEGNTYGQRESDRKSLLVYDGEAALALFARRRPEISESKIWLECIWFVSTAAMIGRIAMRAFVLNARYSAELPEAPNAMTRIVSDDICRRATERAIDEAGYNFVKVMESMGTQIANPYLFTPIFDNSFIQKPGLAINTEFDASRDLAQMAMIILPYDYGHALDGGEKKVVESHVTITMNGVSNPRKNRFYPLATSSVTGSEAKVEIANE